MHVETLRLEAGETVRDDLEPFTRLIEMIQTFSEAEIVQVVGQQFIAQEAGELLVLPEQGAFAVRPKDVVAVVDDGSEFAAQFPGEPHTENLADAVGGQSPQTDLATALEDFVDRKMAFENEVPAVLDLRDGVKARETHLLRSLFENFGPRISVQ